MISVAAVWIQGGWGRQDLSSVTDLLSMIYHFVFLFLKAYEHRITVVLYQDTDIKRFYGLFIKFRWGKEFPRRVCGECICLLSYWHNTCVSMGAFHSGWSEWNAQIPYTAERNALVYTLNYLWLQVILKIKHFFWRFEGIGASRKHNRPIITL